MTLNNLSSQTTEILIRAKSDLVLNAGKVREESNNYVLTPPETTLFDQLWSWLAVHPRKNDGIRNYALGIGATALCFRYGTYLSVLMDSSPFYPPPDS